MSQELGTSITSALGFVKEVFTDVHTLATTMELELGKRGWSSANGSRVANGLGNSLHAESWVLSAFTRIYARKGQGATIREALCFEIDFLPASFDQPMCLVVGASFDEGVKPKEEIWDKWEVTDHVCKYFVDGKGPALPEELFEGFMPRASKISGFCIPLCSLDSTDALMRELVTPALALLA